MWARLSFDFAQNFAHAEKKRVKISKTGLNVSIQLSCYNVYIFHKKDHLREYP
jgi:hypothetical protein